VAELSRTGSGTEQNNKPAPVLVGAGGPANTRWAGG